MLIWPKAVNDSDPDWARACALLQVLALDPRQPSLRGHKPRPYFETADDFLVRPEIWVDRKRVPAPYYSYSLRFNVSASVHGSISVAAADQLEEFRRAVNAAIQAPLTAAERKRWEATNAAREREAAGDPKAEYWLTIAHDEGRKAQWLYDATRERIASSRRGAGYVAAGLCSHEEVLEELVRIGTFQYRGNRAAA